MSAYSSSQAGNWSAQATWGGSGPPGDGDTVTISHSITVDVNTTVGSSPSTGGTPAITAGSGSAGPVLTVAAGITLTLKGDVSIPSPKFLNVVVSAGASLVFLPPSGQQYKFTVAYVGALICNGTSGSHCTVKTDKSAGGLASYMNITVRPGLKTATFTDFIDMGDSTHAGIVTSCSNSDAANMSITDCTFLRSSYKWVTLSANFNYDYTFSRNVFTSSVAFTGSRGVTCGFDTNVDVNSAGGVWTVSYNSFDLRATSTNHAGVSWLNNYFAAGLVFDQTYAWTFQNNLIYTGQDTISARSLSNCYLLHSDSNPHGFGGITGANFTVENCIFESTYAGHAVGDLIFPATGAGVVTLVQNCLVVPNAAGHSMGKLISPLGWGAATQGTIQALHNTMVSTTTTESSIAEYGETGNGRAGMFTAIKSNLVWTPAGMTAGQKYFRMAGATVVQDACAAADADYNAGYGLVTGTDGKGYNSGDATHAFTGTPGAHDIDGQDPQFVDSTRRVATWGAMKGTDGSLAAALALIAANPALIYNAGDATTLIPWIRAGFAPRNPAYRNAGHDGVTIGAVEGVWGNPYYAYAQQ